MVMHSDENRIPRQSPAHTQQPREASFFDNLVGSIFFCDATKCTPSAADPREPQNSTGICGFSNSTESHNATKAHTIVHAEDRFLKPLLHSDCAPHIPPWEREPEPLEGWTKEEQLALATAARANYRERALLLGRGMTEETAHWQFLRLLARHVPGKSAQECDRCLKHVEARRIAYFGPPSRSTSNSPLRASTSPMRSSAPSRTGSAASAEPPPPRTGSAAGRAH
jgi:hypothetical protein